MAVEYTDLTVAEQRINGGKGSAEQPVLHIYTGIKKLTMKWGPRGMKQMLLDLSLLFEFVLL